MKIRGYVRNNIENAEINKYLVLNLIRKAGSISRYEIAEETGLSRASITKFTNGLIEENWIQELTTEIFVGDSTPGRRPQPLVLNSNKGLSIGIDLGAGRLKGVLVNFGGELLSHIVQDIDREADNEQVVSLLRSAIDKLLSSVSERGRGKVQGIGLGVSGIMDEDEEICFSCINMPNIRNVDFKHLLEEEFPYRVYMKDSAMMMAVNERRFGACKNEDNFVYIDWGVSVGGAICVDGNILNISDGGIGHISVKENGPQCFCGKQGCLESLISEGAIIRRAKALLKTDDTTVLKERELNLETVFQASREGDPLARRITDEAGVYLGLGISHVVSLLNPRIVVVGGGVADSWNVVESHVKRTAKMHVPRWEARKVSIRASEGGVLAGALGAATYVVDEIMMANQFGI